MKKHLLIPHNGLPDDWYEHLQLQVVSVKTKLDDPRFDPPRIHAMLDDEHAEELANHEMVRLCVCVDPLTDKEMADKILELYRVKNSFATNAANALLDLAARLQKLPQ